jgi:hypothetical protein
LNIAEALRETRFPWRGLAFFGLKKKGHCDVDVDDGWNEKTFPIGRICQVCQDI